jgi:hypothetical protein
MPRNHQDIILSDVFSIALDKKHVNVCLALGPSSNWGQLCLRALHPRRLRTHHIERYTRVVRPQFSAQYKAQYNAEESLCPLLR